MKVLFDYDMDIEMVQKYLYKQFNVSPIVLVTKFESSIAFDYG